MANPADIRRALKEGGNGQYELVAAEGMRSAIWKHFSRIRQVQIKLCPGWLHAHGETHEGGGGGSWGNPGGGEWLNVHFPHVSFRFAGGSIVNCHDNLPKTTFHVM